jgi:hypothetical protein
MRKLAVVLLCCLVIAGCNKKSEQEAAEDELIANATMPQVGTAPDTAPPVATESVVTTSTPPPAATGTPPATSTGSASATTTRATEPPVDVFAPPRRNPEYLVDTIYSWPREEIQYVAKHHPPGIQYFHSQNATNLAAKRKRDGWTAVETIAVAGEAVRDKPFNYPHVLVVYEKK